METLRYAAFISYRHGGADQEAAAWLHRAIETYRIPKPLASRLGRPARVGRVFRDDEELAAATSLSAEIRGALEQSESMIVVCSPRTPSSIWVDAEIACFRSLGRGDRIYPVLVAGAPSVSFPKELGTQGGSGGGPLSGELGLPLAVDLRPTAEARPKAARRLALLRVVAALIGVRFDDLRQREQERRVRRLVGLSVVLALLIALVGAMAFFALEQRDEARAATARERDALGRERAATAAEKQAKEEETTAKNAALEAKGKAELAKAAAEESDRRTRVGLANLLREQARQLLREGSPDKALAYLTAAGREHPDVPEIRSLLAHAAVSQRGLLRSLRGHAGALYSVGLLGSRLLTHGEDGHFVVWDETTGQVKSAFDVADDSSRGGSGILPLGEDSFAAVESTGIRIWSTSPPRSPAFLPAVASSFSEALSIDPTRRWLATVGTAVLKDSRRVSDATVRLWDLEGGREVAALAHGDRCVQAEFSRDGLQCVTAADDRTVRVWSVKSGAPLARLVHDDVPQGAAFLPDGRILVSAGDHLHLWPAGVTPSRPTPIAIGFSGRVVVSPVGDRAVLVGPALSVCLVDVEKLAAIRTIGASYDHSGSRSVVFSPSGRWLLVRQEHHVRILDARSGATVSVLARQRSLVTAACFLADESQVAVASDDGSASLWDWRAASAPDLLGLHERATWLLSAPDGKSVLGATFGGTVMAWDRATGAVRRKWSLPRSQSVGVWGSGAPIVAAGGTRVALTRGDDSLVLADLRAESSATRALPGGHALGALAMDATGSRLATGSDDGTVRVWPMPTGAEVTVGTLPRSVVSLAWCDGDRVLVATDGAALVGIDVTSKAPLWSRKPPRGRWTWVVASPQGDWVAAGDRSQVVALVDPRTGADRCVSPELGQVPASLAIAPDGRTAACPGDDKILFFDTASGRVRSQWVEPKGHRIRSIAFLPGADEALVAAAFDATLLDVRTGTEVETVAKPGFEIDHVTVSQDGDWAWVADATGVVSSVPLRRQTSLDEADAAVARLGAWRVVDGTLLPVLPPDFDVEHVPVPERPVEATSAPSPDALSLARLAFASGDLVSAEAESTRAIDAGQALLDALELRARARHVLGKDEPALVDVDAALALPQSERAAAELHALKGEVLLSLRRLEDAIVETRAAIRAFYRKKDAHVDAAERLLDADAPLLAIALLEEDPARKEATPTRVAARARALAALGQVEEARRSIDELLVQDPKNARALYVRGTCRFQGGDFRGAIADASAVIEQSPTHVFALLLRAEARRQVNALDVDLEDLDAAVKVAPSLSIARWRRAIALTTKLLPRAPRPKADDPAWETVLRGWQEVIETSPMSNHRIEALRRVKELEELRQAIRDGGR